MKTDINPIWLRMGYVDEDIDSSMDLISEILNLKKRKNAIIMAHFYQDGVIQDIADIIGDSLALAQKANNIDSGIIVMCGVGFMGETVKIINPDKKVLLPDLNAGCSLADSCNPSDFKKFIDQYPDHTVISYVNTSAQVKAMSHCLVTSSNALKIINYYPKDEKIIFGPDKNLGSYINKLTGRNMLLWNGACHVHERFELDNIHLLSSDVMLISHPECKKEISDNSDFVGSTSELLSFVGKSSCNKFKVATECGILHQMRKIYPNKKFESLVSKDSIDGCNVCEYMKLITLKKIYLTLKYEWPEIIIEPNLLKDARRSIDTMLKLSE